MASTPDERGAIPPDARQPVRLVRVGPAWARRYREAGEELLGALGDAMREPGGRLLELHHVGSTAVPGLLAKPTLDLMGRLARWPLDAAAIRSLDRLGYRDHGEHGLPGRHFLTRGGHDVHLHLLAPDGERLLAHLAFRDLLRSDPEARAAYDARKRELVDANDGDRAAYVAGKDGRVRDLTARALRREAARQGFAPLHELVRLGHRAAAVGASPGSWALGGGWALDLAVGRARRPHRDVDVVLDHAAAAGWLAAVATEGPTFRVGAREGAAPWRPGDPLPPPPASIEARVGSALAEAAGAVGSGGRPVFWDVVLERRPRGRWVLRTDPAVGLDIARAVRELPVPAAEDARPLPTLVPELVLLTKARLSGRIAGEAKDDGDLSDVLPLLDGAARAWLRDALARPPAHPWARRLADPGGGRSRGS